MALALVLNGGLLIRMIYRERWRLLINLEKSSRKGAKDADGKKKNEEILPRTTQTNTNDSNYLIVPKEKIAESGEYNLSGERYRETEQRGKQK